jgi:hypothetical protein
MNEPNLDQILEKKINRLERWMKRLDHKLYVANQELLLMKHAANLNDRKHMSSKTVQLEFFKRSG